MKSYLIAVSALFLLLLTVRPAVALDADSELVRSLARQIAPRTATAPAAAVIAPASVLERLEPPSEPARTPRSIAFPVLATTSIALNAIDIYTTTKAIGSGRGVEANPVLGSVAGTPAALTAAKIATTATTLILARKLWKEHKTASIALLVTANVGMGFVAAHNTRVAGGF